MSLLYFIFFILILGGISFIVLAFSKTKPFPFGFLGIFALGLTVFSLTLYHLSGNKTDLSRWLTAGQDHYELMQKVAELGGEDAIILRIETKLKNNPNDALGWLILSKLYAAKHEDEKARIAFLKSKTLNQNNSL